ncbi:hypothetical protein BLNAU_16445 [Blattamonas nauphoetae]|uniref:Uncharacterized protein n=1 Tax=Blattamonas nauphoetae TaxID=2049346 RepID=A0ABQ9XE89_9EUKA|nr:hypothetical protein BLNAU_16445 [Blattamonas nauphoetae]
MFGICEGRSGSDCHKHFILFHLFGTFAVRSDCCHDSGRVLVQAGQSDFLVVQLFRSIKLCLDGTREHDLLALFRLFNDRSEIRCDICTHSENSSTNSRD